LKKKINDYNKKQRGNNMAVVNPKEDWMQNKWRPAMGWMYMAVCVFDFIVAPVLWSIIQLWETEAANDAFRQWAPLTLQSGGFFHIAMGAVLGISAFGRTKEKTAAIENGATDKE
jgi:hypothetical protein